MVLLELNYLMDSCSLLPNENTVPKIDLEFCGGCCVKSLNMNKLLEKKSPSIGKNFSELTQYYIDSIVFLGLEISQYQDIGKLAQLFPGFPNGMTRLKKFEILLKRTISPPYDSSSQPHDIFSSRDLDSLGAFDSLLTLLDGNLPPKQVVLIVPEATTPTHYSSQGQAQINLRQHQSMKGHPLKRFECQVSDISPLEDATVEIHTADKEGAGLDHLLSFIKFFGKPPTGMCMDGIEGSIKLSAPNRSFSFCGLSHQEMSSFLTESVPISLENIQKLHLIKPPKASPLNSLLYPALKFLTIDEDTDIPTTLSELFSSQESSLSRLERLEIKHCTLSQLGIKRSLHHSPQKLLLTNSEKHQSLLVEGCSRTEIAYMVSCISFLKGAQAKTYTTGEGTGSDCIFSSIRHVEESPTHMNLDGTKGRVQLSGPNGSVDFHGLSYGDMHCLLVEETPHCFSGIQKLHLIQPPTALPFNPSLYPALKTLIIENCAEVSQVLFKLLSSPQSFPMVQKLEIKSCTHIPDDIDYLRKHKKVAKLSLLQDWISHLSQVKIKMW